jgi:hypothetical protein
MKKKTTQPTERASVYVEPRAVVPVLVVGFRNVYGWKADGQPTGLFGAPGRGGAPSRAYLKQIGGRPAGGDDLRGTWSAKADVTGEGVALNIGRRLRKVRVSITGRAPAVDGPWSWAWTVQRDGALDTAGEAQAGTDWPDVCKAVLRDALDIERSRCGAEGLTRPGRSTAAAAGLKQYTRKGEAAPVARGETAPAPTPTTRPSRRGAAPAERGQQRQLL